MNQEALNRRAAQTNPDFLVRAARIKRRRPSIPGAQGKDAETSVVELLTEPNFLVLPSRAAIERL